MTGYRIGEAAEKLGLTPDTLRYYEKIGLLAIVRKGAARLYTDKDLSRLRFVKRAQSMGFSLEEVKRLLEFRDRPQSVRASVRQLAASKLEEIETRLEETRLLRNELQLLLNLCTRAKRGCPIIERIERRR